jgi:hypothetical protein
VTSDRACGSPDCEECLRLLGEAASVLPGAPGEFGGRLVRGWLWALRVRLRLRYFSITLAAYVGEPVTIRYDPRDLAEIRVYHRDKFLCQAVSPDIAAVTVSLQDLQAARNQGTDSKDIRVVHHPRRRRCLSGRHVAVF